MFPNPTENQNGMLTRISVPVPFATGRVNAYVAGRTVVDPEVRDVKGYSEGVRHVVTEATVE